MKSILYNWSEDKGINPFEYGLEWPQYESRDLCIEYINDEESKNLHENILYSPNCHKVGIYLEFRDLVFIQSPQVSNLIHATEIICLNGDKILDHVEVIDKIDNIIDRTKPIIIYADYPLSSDVKITIYPMIMKYYNSNYYEGYTIGYICWQVAIAYRLIFEKEYKEAGVWGHGLSDLMLSHLHIHENNIITLSIDS